MLVSSWLFWESETLIFPLQPHHRVFIPISLTFRKAGGFCHCLQLLPFQMGTLNISSRSTFFSKSYPFLGSDQYKLHHTKRSLFFPICVSPEPSHWLFAMGVCPLLMGNSEISVVLSEHAFIYTHMLSHSWLSDHVFSLPQPT